MFMMSQKRKRAISAVIAIVLSLGLMVSAMAGYFMAR